MMARSKIFFGVLVLLIIGVTVKLTVPITYEELPLKLDVIEALEEQSGISNNPVHYAECYLFYGRQKSDWPSSENLSIAERYTSSNLIRITVEEKLKGDSVYETVDRLYFAKEEGCLVLIRHEHAFKGRKKFGWSTGRSH